jgi:tetratricopeptide (TPR) repeat protein
MRVLAARAVARRDFARGLAMLREVVARHPEDAEASIDLADRLLAHGDSGAARRLVDRLGGIDDVRVRLLHARVNADEKGASRALAAIPAGGPAGEGRVARWWSGLRIRAELATAPADCPPATTRRCVAIEVLENESEADPDSLARVAWAWARAGRTDRAAAAVRRVVAAPDATAWHRLRGAGVLAAVGDFDGVESALRAASGTVTARESRAHDDLSAALAVHKAKRERAAGLPGDAVRRLEPLVSARPGDADALVALGLAYADIGLRAAASQAAERAVRLRPSEPELWIDAARCFRAAGDDTRAGEAIRQALALLDDPARRRTAAAGENPVPAGVRALLGRGTPADPQRLRMEIESSGL